MRRFMQTTILCMILIGIITGFANAEQMKIYTAFSLNSARKLLESGPLSDEFRERQMAELRTIGGITRIVAIVLDKEGNDIILLGEHVPNAPELLLDDFVKTVRAAYLYGLTFIGVSIEPRENDTYMQDVVFYAGTENSHLGEILLVCDYLLKKIGLEFQDSKVAGEQTYYRFAIEHSRRNRTSLHRVCSRFWFYPTGVDVDVYDDSIIIRTMNIEVLTQTLSAEVNGEKIEPSTYTDESGAEFVAAFNKRFHDFKKEFKVFYQLENLGRCAALTKGLPQLVSPEDVEYWLKDYRMNLVDTPTKVEVLRKTYSEDNWGLELFGGVRIVALASRMKRTNPMPLTDLVIASKPATDSLTWQVIVSDGASFQPNPDDAKMIEHLKQALYVAELQKYAEAIEQADAALQIDPNLAEAWQLKGLIYREWGLTIGDESKFAASVACLKRSVRAYPNYADAHFELAASYNLLRMPDLAIEHYSTAVSIAPDYYQAFLGLAYAYNAKKDRAEAIRCLEKYLNYDVDSKDAEQARQMLEQLKRTPERERTSSGMLETYSNAEHGFSFAYPTDWQITSQGDASAKTENNLDGEIVFSVMNPLDIYQSFTFYAIAEESGSTTGKDEFDRFFDAIESGTAPDVRFLGMRPISIGNVRATQYLISTKFMGVDLKKKIIVFRRDNVIYLMVFEAEVNDFDKANQKCFQKVIESFNWESR